MSRKELEKISQREYAHRLGVSNEAVSKAVREGRIKNGWCLKEKKIIPEKADLEWGMQFRTTNVDEIVNEDQQIGGDGMKLTSRSSLMEAKRVREIIQAQISALELKQRKAELVDKKQVFKEIFSIGQKLRIAIMATPDRVIDNILAAKSRAEAHNILTSSLYAVLDDFVNENEKNLQN